MSVNRASGFEDTAAIRGTLIDKGALSDESLARHLPYLSVREDDVILTRQGDLMASALINGIDSLTSEGLDLHGATNSMAHIAGQLGEEFGYYVNKITLPDTVDLARLERGSFACEIDERWRTHLAKRGLKRRVILLTVLIRPMIGAKLPLLGRLVTSSFSSNLQDRKARLDEAMTLIGGALQGIGFRRLKVSDGEWLGLLGAVQGQPYGKIIADKGRFLAPALTNIDVTFRGKSFEIETGRGTRYGVIFGVKNYAAKTWPKMLDDLESRFDMVITNSFAPMRNNAAEARVKLVARQMRASEDSAETLRQELFQAADNVASGRQVFGKHHLTIMATADTRDDAEEAAALIWRSGQDAGLTLVREGFGARTSYFAQAPGNWTYRFRPALVSAHNFAQLAAFHRSTRGRDKADSPWGQNITALPTVNGGLYRMNLHDRGKCGAELSAGHTLILGRTGSGKTLGTAFLMAQARRVNARLIIIDKDRGLEMAVRALGGVYSGIRVGEPTGMNPFATETDPRGAAWLVDWLTDNLERSRPLETIQTVALNRAVEQVVTADASLRSFDALATLLASTDDGGDLASRVHEWTSKGRYGWLFACETKTPVRIGEDVVGIDMSEILDTNAERGALLAYLFRRVERVIEDRRPTMIVIDEAWKMLDDEIFVKRLHDWLVTMRKKNTAVVMLTQTPSHLTQSRVGSVIAESVTTQILYPNARANPEDYRILRVNETEAAFLSAPDGGYRIALIRSAGESVLVDLDLSALKGGLTVLGGGESGVEKAPPNWRETPDFWKEMLR